MKRILFLIVGIVILFSCEYENGLLTTVKPEITSQYLLNGHLVVYLQNNQIFRHKGKPGVAMISIGNQNLSDYEDCFILYVATGDTPETTVSSAIIKLDGLEVLNTSDFSNSKMLRTFEICYLTEQSVLQVEVRGTPGSYLDIWIEGEQKCPCTVTDSDGNIYKTVKIGNQCWMAENLKTTRYNDGIAIQEVTENAGWAALTTSGYCWFNNDAATYKATYGALYNWYAVNTSKLCPIGWHVPTDMEWTSLSDYLTNNGYGFEGSGSDIGKSLASTSGWTSYGIAGSVGNDQANNNSSGFAGQPGGGRDYYGTCLDNGNFAYWWSSTEFGPNIAWDRYLYFQHNELEKNDVNFTKQDGFSIRCIKN